MQYDSIIKLPWEIQVPLASGYAAYIIAYTGIREHHKTIDTTFITLAFGLVSTGAIMATQRLMPLAEGAIAVAATLAAGFLWRRWGIEMFARVMRQKDLSWADNAPSSWATLITQSRHPISQIAVLLDDGTWLRCDDTSRFSAAPFGPCRLGPNGDVAIYLTHEQKPDAEARQLNTTSDDFYGDRITYIPAGKIKRVTFRHKRQVNRRSTAVAVARLEK